MNRGKDCVTVLGEKGGNGARKRWRDGGSGGKVVGWIGTVPTLD